MRFELVVKLHLDSKKEESEPMVTEARVVGNEHCPRLLAFVGCHLSLGSRGLCKVGQDDLR